MLARLCTFSGLPLVLLILFQCKSNVDSFDISKATFQHLADRRSEAEKNDDLKTFLSFYEDGAIVMPEYQLKMDDSEDVKKYYEEIFRRQDVKKLVRTSTEIIPYDSTMIETGIFLKIYCDQECDSLSTQHGKYFNVWKVQNDGTFKLQGESFGFTHPLDHPELHVVKEAWHEQPDDSEILAHKEIPFELKAYNALMEKGVRTRNALLRAAFFTEDGSFMPFADSTVAGMEKIRPYLIEYSRGDAIIDSIMCYTYHYKYLGRDILEYDMFKVKWSVNNYWGRAEGKGIRLWKRMEDNSLRLHREIGTHNHLN